MSGKSDRTVSEQAALVGGAAPPPGLGPRRQNTRKGEPKPTQGREKRKPRNVPGVGRVMLVSTEDGMTLRARLDDGYPLVFGGYGGWEDEPRPGQVSATVFRGASAPQLKLKLILGRWPLGDARDRAGYWATNCEQGMRMLEHFARLPIDAPRQDRPTLLRIRGYVPDNNRRWFIQDIEWGEVDVAGGRRIRALVTVTLRTYVPVRLLDRRRRAARPIQRHRVKKGETLDRILNDKLEIDGAKHLNLARDRALELNKMRRGDRLVVDRLIKLPRGNWWRKPAPRPSARGRR